MSVQTLKPARPKSRLRKVWCPYCGYTVQMARSWIAVGVPCCPNPECDQHGLELECADIADAIIAGISSLDELPRTVRTQVCRANGWEDSIIRTSPAQMSRRERSAKRVGPDVPHCAHIGCSRYVRAGETYCTDHQVIAVGAEMPF